jgi:hypothetical protein
VRNAEPGGKLRARFGYRAVLGVLVFGFEGVCGLGHAQRITHATAER